MNVLAIVAQCAPLIAPSTAHAVITVESGGNPHAIGVVGGRLQRQPVNLAEAVATVQALEAGGWNYSVGLGQINRVNFKRLGLTPETAFDACANARAMQVILGECFERAVRTSDEEQVALRRALSCYYSGNFNTGFVDGYVQRVTEVVRYAPGAPSAGAAQKLTGSRTDGGRLLNKEAEAAAIARNK